MPRTQAARNTRPASGGRKQETPAPSRRKQESHEKVLRAAARAIRAEGPGRVGVLEVMREAGLTHGGFYAHFASKDALIAEAIAWMFASARAKREARAALDPDSDTLDAWIESYVSRRHRDDPGSGCPLTALISHMPHASPEARAAFDAGLANMAGRVAGKLKGSEAKRRQQALALIAQMAGAVALSRAVSDPALSDSILDSARTELRQKVA
ncbi:TetR/AcrR family transcriptional regulator [Ferrovibrio sp. MS7]|uniref:TetR/AcrR family transcriptional regulator n=1 Tax=Ferrovibrio plantarum TaxID=3119164 RepID=UPI003134DAAB